jgi:hypothetical protein
MKDTVWFQNDFNVQGYRGLVRQRSGQGGHGVGAPDGVQARLRLEERDRGGTCARAGPTPRRSVIWAQRISILGFPVANMNHMGFKTRVQSSQRNTRRQAFSFEWVEGVF